MYSKKFSFWVNFRYQALKVYFLIFVVCPEYVIIVAYYLY